MYRLKKNALFIVMIIALSGVVSLLLWGDFFGKDRTDRIYDEMMSSKNGIDKESISYLQGELIQCTESKYDLSLILPVSWEGCAAFEDGQTTDSPMHDMLKTLDKDYRTLRIRHPKWAEDTPRQDIVLSIFRVDEWNENASVATKNQINLLPAIVHFNSKYVLAIDPNNYDMRLEGYDEVLMILLEDEKTSGHYAGYRYMDGAWFETENVMYDLGMSEVRVKWENILKDGIICEGSYVLERKTHDRWEEVTLDSKKDSISTHTPYEVTTRKTDWENYKLTDYAVALIAGEYRIGIDFLRKSLYGIDIKPENYPKYRAYDEFRVGDESIARDTKSDDEEESLYGVGLETEYEAYEVGTLEVRVKWYNTLSDEMMYGEYFTLEREVEGGWEQVMREFGDDVCFNAIGYVLPPNDERWHVFNLISYTEGLVKGKYRLNTSFSRMTYDGEDFGSGNYPNYQVYGYFEVGDKKIKRDLMNLRGTRIEYLNEKFGFSLYLPEDWVGYSVLQEGQNIESPMHDLLSDLDSGYSTFIIRHPEWKEDVLRQDIVFTIIRSEQWNKNAHEATNSQLSLLPETVYSNWTYIFAIDPYNYDETLEGNDEVFDIMRSHIKDY